MSDDMTIYPDRTNDFRTHRQPDKHTERQSHSTGEHKFTRVSNIQTNGRTDILASGNVFPRKGPNYKQCRVVSQ
jgi:hypothetical protein